MITSLIALATATVALLSDRSSRDQDLQQWGQRSKVRDEDGRLLLVHHGSGTDIQEFSYEFTGVGHDQHGSGFYFTTDLEEAASYTVTRKESDMEKPGGEDQPTVVHAYLDIKNPLDSEHVKPINMADVRAFMRMAPSDDWLVNWGDVDWEGRATVMTKAARAYTSYPEDDQPLVRALFSIANDIYGDDVEAFNRAVEKIFGYDGVVVRFPESRHSHYIAFFPQQIRLVEKTRGPLLETS